MIQNKNSLRQVEIRIAYTNFISNKLGLIKGSIYKGWFHGFFTCGSNDDGLDNFALIEFEDGSMYEHYTLDTVRFLDRGEENKDKMKWTSVKDELPQVGKRVLVATECALTFEGHRRMTGDWAKANGLEVELYYGKVTHWIPLPEMPTRKEKDDE